MREPLSNLITPTFTSSVKLDGRRVACCCGEDVGGDARMGLGRIGIRVHGRWLSKNTQIYSDLLRFGQTWSGAPGASDAEPPGQVPGCPFHSCEGPPPGRFTNGRNGCTGAGSAPWVGPVDR